MKSNDYIRIGESKDVLDYFKHEIRFYKKIKTEIETSIKFLKANPNIKLGIPDMFDMNPAYFPCDIIELHDSGKVKVYESNTDRYHEGHIFEYTPIILDQNGNLKKELSWYKINLKNWFN